MPRWIRRRLTYANVIATLALFLALNVGAYAAIKMPAEQRRPGATEEQGGDAEEGLARGDQALQGEKGRRAQGAKGCPAPQGPEGQPSRSPRSTAGQGTTVASQTKNVADANITHPASGVYCFALPFTPKSAIVNGSNLGGANDTLATVYVRRAGDGPPDDCAGNDNVRVRTLDLDGNPSTVSAMYSPALQRPRFLHLVRIRTIGGARRACARARCGDAARGLEPAAPALDGHGGGDRGVRDRVRARPRAVRGCELGRRRRRLAVRRCRRGCSSSCTSRCSRPRTGASSCRSSIRSPEGSRRSRRSCTRSSSSARDPSAGEIAGVVVVAAGVLLVRGARGSRGAALGLVIAAVIGGYTVIDRYGIQHANAFSYAFLILLPAGADLSAVRRTAPRSLVGRRRSNVLVGVLSAAAYLLVLLALRRASAPAVAAVRETGVVIAAVLGAVFLHERVGAARYAGAALVVARHRLARAC